MECVITKGHPFLVICHTRTCIMTIEIYLKSILKALLYIKVIIMLQVIEICIVYDSYKSGFKMYFFICFVNHIWMLCSFPKVRRAFRLFNKRVGIMSRTSLLKEEITYELCWLFFIAYN
ncbi:hypothetical protein HanPI659440_Chr09g0321311 [Helianthus annuus]|nr:hypothetical protein HanPI659440_Chr09g0321311 [Helianthus annuus]